MKSMIRILWLLALCGTRTYAADGGAITGSVKDQSGAPFMGAFVQAQHATSRISTYVLTDRQGRYRVANLPAGDYELRVTAVGYTSEPRPGVKVAAGEAGPVDLTLKKGLVRWRDLNTYQGKQLLPAGEGKDLLEANCYACHQFQTRMAAVQRDEDGWKGAVSYMRDVMRPRLGNHITDDKAATIAGYLNKTFGMDSTIARSPADLPGYKDTVRTFGEESTRIVYVEYEMPGPNRMPFSAAPDKDGALWIPDFGRSNRIGRLDPDTGKIEEFMVPHQGTAGIHSAVPGPDGAVWIGEQASNKVGKWDPKTRTVTEYQDAYAPGLQGLEDGGSKHTLRVDPLGRVWGSAVRAPLAMFDPKTNEFRHFREVESPYGLAIDAEGSVWFAEFKDGGTIGKVDAATSQVSKFSPPTSNGWPRRIEIDSKGIIWFAEYRAGKIGRFDPKTRAFKEFPLPGPSPTPYALGIDQNDYIWYSADYMDVLGRLNPHTGEVTEYPYPHAENMMKEFFRDAKGRMWYGAPTNNKVGYFLPPPVK